MVSPDMQPRARSVWLWVVVLVALAVVVPVMALVDRDAPRTAARDHTSAPPAETRETDPAPAPSRGPVRALFFGDSYFVGGGYTGEDNSMARLASNRLGWVSEINGAGGTGFVTALPEYGLGNYLEQIEGGAFDVGRRTWVIIEGGNNDRWVPLDQVKRNARKVVRIAQRTFPKATVVLMGPLDPDGDYADSRPMVKVLRNVARKRGVPFINDMKWLQGNYHLVGPDDSHPTPEGHRLLGRKLAKSLRQLGA